MRLRIILFILAAVIGSAAMAQEMEKMNELDKKSTATYGDAVMLFKAQTKKNVSLDYNTGDPLTRGMVALMTAKCLDLHGSLLYNIFGTERYAYRACVAAEIMDEDESENDLMSGAELLEVMARIAEKEGGE